MKITFKLRYARFDSVHLTTSFDKLFILLLNQVPLRTHKTVDSLTALFNAGGHSAWLRNRAV